MKRATARTAANWASTCLSLRHILNPQPDRRIAKDHEIPRIIASDPQIAERFHRNVGATLQVGVHVGQIGGYGRPAQVEHVCGLSNALAAQQPPEHIPESLNL